MTPHLWNQFVPHFKTKPAVNQVECNPFCQQKELRKIMAQDDVKLECYYPLGHGNKELLNHSLVQQLAHKYHKNAGQIILRFEVQDGLIVLPKSSQKERIKGNIDIFDFQLSEEDMKTITNMNKDTSSFFSHYDPATVEMICGLKR